MRRAGAAVVVTASIALVIALVRDRAFAAEARAQHDADLAHSVELSPLSHRPAAEKLLAWAIWTLSGQRWALRVRRGGNA